MTIPTIPMSLLLRVVGPATLLRMHEASTLAEAARIGHDECGAHPTGYGSRTYWARASPRGIEWWTGSWEGAATQVRESGTLTWTDVARIAREDA